MGCCRGGLQGLLPGQGSAAFGGADYRGLEYRGQDRVQQRFVEQEPRSVRGSGGAALRRDEALERVRAVHIWKPGLLSSSNVPLKI